MEQWSQRCCGIEDDQVVAGYQQVEAGGRYRYRVRTRTSTSTSTVRLIASSCADQERQISLLMNGMMMIPYRKYPQKRVFPVFLPGSNPISISEAIGFHSAIREFTLNATTPAYTRC